MVGIRSVCGGGSVCMWWGLGLYVVRSVCGGLGLYVVGLGLYVVGGRSVCGEVCMWWG